MLELTFLIVMNHLMSWGRAPVIVNRSIAADAAALLALVRDPGAQWRLVAGLSPALRPHADVQPSTSSRVVTVGVQLRGRPALRVTWILTPRRGTTEVDLAAQLQSGSLLARLVLLFGGRRWLRRHLQRTLGALAALAHDAAEDIHDLERDPAIASGRGSVRCT
jgi:hypothetical protein